MTGQSRPIDAIMQDRIAVVQAIAEANTEQLRLNQMASGMMVLDMKDARDGVSDSDHEAAQSRTDTALEANLARISQLEDRLSTLDRELAAAMKENG